MVESIDKLSKYGIFDNKDLNVFKSLFPDIYNFIEIKKQKHFTSVQNKSKKIGIRLQIIYFV